MSHGFEERSESRVEPDKGNHDKDKQANIFQNMFRENYDRGKYSQIIFYFLKTRDMIIEIFYLLNILYFKLY